MAKTSKIRMPAPPESDCGVVTRILRHGQSGSSYLPRARGQIGTRAGALRALPSGSAVEGVIIVNQARMVDWRARHARAAVARYSDIGHARDCIGVFLEEVYNRRRL